jgi:sugar lactone lactonase YvrE
MDHADRTRQLDLARGRLLLMTLVLVLALVGAAEVAAVTLNPGDILVSDGAFGTGAVILVDPVTGAQTTVSTGGSLGGLWGITLDANGDILVAATSTGIIRIDPASGMQTTVSTGGSFVAPQGIAVAASGDLFVVDQAAFGTGAVFRVDPGTGAQTLISSGGNFASPYNLALEADGSILVADPNAFGPGCGPGTGAIVRVNPTSGAQTIVSSGGNFACPGGVAVAPSGEIFVVNGGGAFGGRVVRVDPTNGAQTLVASGGFITTPQGIAVEADGNLVVADPRNLGGPLSVVLRVHPVTGAQTVVSAAGSFGAPLNLVVVPSGPPAGAFTAFLHGSGGTANPPTLFLDSMAPASTTAKYKDSSSVKFSGGNPWKEIGTWDAAPAFSNGLLSTLNPVHGWVGLKNSDDQGTRFDLRVEVRKNDTILVAAGETYCIQGVTRNPGLAQEVVVGFGSFTPEPFDGNTDVVSLAVFTRIGTDGTGGFCGGHSNAVGLRLYFDAVERNSRFDGVFVP